MNELQPIRRIILVGGILAVAVCFWIFNGSHEVRTRIVITGILIILFLILRGMWQFRRWALISSYPIALMFFFFGCFLASFGMTFYPGEIPPLYRRLKDAFLNPIVPSVLLSSTAWLIYFIRPKIWRYFE